MLCFFLAPDDRRQACCEERRDSDAVHSRQPGDRRCHQCHRCHVLGRPKPLGLADPAGAVGGIERGVLAAYPFRRRVRRLGAPRWTACLLRDPHQRRPPRCHAAPERRPCQIGDCSGLSVPRFFAPSSGPDKRGTVISGQARDKFLEK